GQAETGGGVVGRADVPAPRVEHPLGEPGMAAGGEDERHLPAAVGPLARVPLRLVHVRAEGGEALGQHLAQPAARPGSPRARGARRGGCGPPGPRGPGTRVHPPPPPRTAVPVRSAPRPRQRYPPPSLRPGYGPESPWVARDSPLRSRTERAGRTALAPRSAAV